MMAGFMSYFGARKDPKQAARDAIVNLRQQLQMIDKKEEYLQKKIDEETKKARANAVSNKTGSTLSLLASPLLITWNTKTG
jgi:charged multivesicular body protein 4